MPIPMVVRFIITPSSISWIDLIGGRSFTAGLMWEQADAAFHGHKSALPDKH